MSKPGRNDPCYCGSGLKYKKCHEPLDKAAEKGRQSVLEAGRYLRRDFLKYARDERFAEALAAALPHYWNGLYTVENAEEMSQNEAMRFFDWFVFDYQYGSEPRLIEVYYRERRDDLSSHQQELLDAWQQAPPAAAYELLGYEGQTLRLRDIIAGDRYDVHEPGGHGETESGDLILARLVPVLDHLEFSTVAAYLPQDEIGDLAEKLLAARSNYHLAYPLATYTEFMRRHNTIMIHHALDQANRQGRPPVARLDLERKASTARTAARQIRRLQTRR